MNKTESKIEFEVFENQTGGIPVIVVAAGSSTRMGQNKMLISVSGLPVLVRTLKAFEECDQISNIILVAKGEELITYKELCDKYMLTKVKDIIEGGQNRQESVLCGMERLKNSDQRVLIHDGARPLVSNEIICRVIDGLNRYAAVVPVVKVKDTIKQIAENGEVIKTVKRDDLVQVQTPQGVYKKEYLKLLKSNDLSLFTDDVSFFEADGQKVLTVTGDYKNIKITTKEDIIIAEAFLKGDICE